MEHPHPLEALERAFGARYDLWIRHGRFYAKRVDGAGEGLAGDTADELAAAIRQDMAAGTGQAPQPDDTDQRMRLTRFRTEHPDVIIRAWEFGTWMARIPEPSGETVVVRHTLGELLDRLGELTGGGQGLPDPRGAIPPGAARQAAVPATAGRGQLRLTPADWYGRLTAVLGEAGSGPKQPDPQEGPPLARPRRRRP